VSEADRKMRRIPEYRMLPITRGCCKGECGWAPQTALADGLVRTIEYLEALLSEGAVRPFIIQDQDAET
jgi:hypothetical protein